MLARFLTSRFLHLLFRWGIVLKGIDALLELVAGVVLLITSQTALQSIITFLTRAEFIEDPHDFLANYVVHAFHGFSLSTQRFSGLYLLAHGVIKTVLVVGLWCERLWAFPTAAIFLTIFVCYQIYRITQQHSIILSALTLFDLVILSLIWREYHQLKRSNQEWLVSSFVR